MNKVLEAAAEILGAKGNYTAETGENLTARLTWKNHAIAAGAPIQVGFLLGDGERIYVFEHGGVHWICGSLADVTAPSITTERTDDIHSKAAWYFDPPEPFDGWGFIGQAVAPINVIAWEGRIIGIHADEFMANMQLLAAKWFANVLTVLPPDEPPPPDVPAEIKDLSFTSA